MKFKLTHFPSFGLVDLSRNFYIATTLANKTRYEGAFQHFLGTM
jgi:hypothetical protein